MRITALTLREFGCYKDAAVSLDHPVVMCFSRNGAGKTTLRRALEVALRGAAADLDGSGLPVSILIRTGSAASTVTATVRPTAEARPVELTRRIMARGTETKINGHTAPKALYDLYLPRGITEPDAVLRALCSATGIFDLGAGAKGAERQKELLLSLVDQAIPPDALTGLPLDAAGETVPPATLVDMAAAYQRIYARRTDVSRELARFQDPVAPLGDMPDVGAIQGKLRDLEGDLERLNRTHGQVLGERMQLERRRVELAELVDQAAVRLHELGTVETARKAVTDIEKALHEAQAAQQAQATAQAKATAADERLRGLRARHEKLTALGRACVISEEVACPLPPADRTAMLATWGEQIGALEQQLAQKRKAAPPRAPIASLERDLSQALRRVEEIEAIGSRHAVGTAEYKAVEGQLATSPATEQADADIPAVRARIAKGRDNLTEALRLVQARDRATADQARRTALTAEQSALHACCEAFGPKGLRERILAERLGALTERINEVLAAFGLQLAFQSDPWAVLLNGIPPALMAESERLRAGLAFQIALAETSGVRLLVVDRLDVLDHQNRGALFGALTLAREKGWVEQAILLATYATAQPPAGPWPADVGAYLITASEQGSAIIPMAPERAA